MAWQGILSKCLRLTCVVNVLCRIYDQHRNLYETYVFWPWNSFFSWPEVMTERVIWKLSQQFHPKCGSFWKAMILVIQENMDLCIYSCIYTLIWHNHMSVWYLWVKALNCIIDSRRLCICCLLTIFQLNQHTSGPRRHVDPAAWRIIELKSVKCDPGGRKIPFIPSISKILL